MKLLVNFMIIKRHVLWEKYQINLEIFEIFFNENFSFNRSFVLNIISIYYSNITLILIIKFYYNYNFKSFSLTQVFFLSNGNLDWSETAVILIQMIKFSYYLTVLISFYYQLASFYQGVLGLKKFIFNNLFEIGNNRAPETPRK